MVGWVTLPADYLDFHKVAAIMIYLFGAEVFHPEPPDSDRDRSR